MKNTATLILNEDDLVYLSNTLQQDYHKALDAYTKLWRFSQHSDFVPSEELAALDYKVDRLLDLCLYFDAVISDLYKPDPDPNDPYPF